MDFVKDLKTYAIREVQKEADLEIEITDIIGNYTNADTIIAYSDGEVRQEFTIVYRGVIKIGALDLDSESTAYQ